MLRFSANIRWIFTEVPFFDRFAAAADAGFRAVEYGWPYEFKPADIRARLLDHDLKLVLINTPQGEASRGEASGQTCLPGREAAFRDSLKLSLDYAAALDCRLVQVQAGIRPMDVPEDQAWDVYLANLAWACETAQSSDVKLIIEPVNQRDIPRFLLRTQAQAAEAIAAVGAERLGLLFDVYHCQTEEGDALARLERAMPTVRHIQIADAPGRKEPGTGDMDWASIFSRIEALAYDGWIGCEYKPETTTAAGLEWRTRYFP